MYLVSETPSQQVQQSFKIAQDLVHKWKTCNPLQSAVAFLYLLRTKPLGFLMFSRAIEKKHQAVMGVSWFSAIWDSWETCDCHGILESPGIFLSLIEKCYAIVFTYNNGGSSIVPVFVSVISSIDVRQMIDYNTAQLFLLTRYFRALA